MSRRTGIGGSGGGRPTIDDDDAGSSMIVDQPPAAPALLVLDTARFWTIGSAGGGTRNDRDEPPYAPVAAADIEPREADVPMLWIDDVVERRSDDVDDQNAEFNDVIAPSVLCDVSRPGLSGLPPAACCGCCCPGPRAVVSCSSCPGAVLAEIEVAAPSDDWCENCVGLRRDVVSWHDARSRVLIMPATPVGTAAGRDADDEDARDER